MPSWSLKAFAILPSVYISSSFAFPKVEVSFGSVKGSTKWDSCLHSVDADSISNTFVEIGEGFRVPKVSYDAAPMDDPSEGQHICVERSVKCQ